MINPKSDNFREQCHDKVYEILELIESIESDCFATDVWEKDLRKLKQVKDSLTQEKALHLQYRKDFFKEVNEALKDD